MSVLHPRQAWWTSGGGGTAARRDLRRTTAAATRCLALALLVIAPPAFSDAAAEDAAAECRRCPWTTGWSGDVWLGPGVVSESSFKFGQFTGLEDSGTFAAAGGDALYMGDDGHRWRLRANDLGLASRNIGVDGGLQGRYRLSMGFDMIPHFTAEDTRTVFRGAGSDMLVLPGDWERAPRTDGMPALADSLRAQPLDFDRRVLRLGLGFLHGQNWESDLQFRRERRDGLRAQGASFLNTTSVLPVALDDRTDVVDAGLMYRADAWQLRLAYHGSFFDNGRDAIVWDNPFTSPNEGGERGRLAVAPDNRFNQLQLAASGRALGWLAASGQFAVGRMEQDQTFLPATINPEIADPPTLPRNSLDGRVDTVNARARVGLRPLRRLRINAEAFYDERNNKTPRDAYEQVPSDLFIGVTRVNVPYGYERMGGKLDASYRFPVGVAVTGGLARREDTRRFQEIEETATTTVWGEARGSPLPMLDLSLRFEREERKSIDAFTPLADLEPPENPLQRRFNFAERRRNLLRLSGGYLPLEQIALGVSVDFVDDEYPDTGIGLTDARDFDYAVDVSFTPNASISTHAFFGQQRNRSEIAGSDQLSVPDWWATHRDRFLSAGGGMQWRGVRPGLDVGLDYVYARARGLIDIDRARDVLPFPDLLTRLNTLQAFAVYQLTSSLSVRSDIWYERFRTEDFFVDEVASNTVPRLLGTGYQSPDYDVVVGVVTVRYRF